ncbi:MAG: hypothetical protein ACPKPY_05235 [Nitrososphaeraceae archaeon]
MDSTFRTAIGITPDGPAMYLGSYTSDNDIIYRQKEEVKKNAS